MRLVRRYRRTLRSQGTFSSGRMQLVLVSAAILECEYQAWLSPSQEVEPPAIPGRFIRAKRAISVGVRDTGALA